MKKALIGVDIGSGGCKVVIIDPEGRLRGQAYQEWPTHYPHPGWSEQNPADWWEALRNTLAMAMSRGEVRPEEVEVVTIGSATHSIVFLGKDDRVLRPAILWTDRRTVKQVAWLKDGYGDLIFQETLHQPNVNWSLPYLVWVREKEPWIWEQVQRILMPKDYIRLQLTGIWATDPIDAVGTLLFNPIEKKWSRRICEAVDIPLCILPPIFLPGEIAGGLTEAAADSLGLREGTPVAVGTTDQASEALGAGAISPGQGIVKLATAGNVAIVTETPHPDPLKVYAYLHLVPNLWYTLTGINSCAVCYRWLRDTFFQDLKTGGEEGKSEYQSMDDMAGQIPIGSEGLMFHPNFHGSFTNPHSKGDFIGITFCHTRAHFARAVLEGVALSLYGAFQRERALGLEGDNFRLIGGGANSPLWRQIVCDVFGKEMRVPAVDDSSFGTAMLGGIATGVFSDVEDSVAKCVRYRGMVKPDEANHRIYQELFQCYREMEESLAPRYQRVDMIQSPVP